MAYVGLEDDTGAMELLVFSRTLGECASYLKAGEALLVEGKLSVRDEKAPQLMCDRVRPLGAPQEAVPEPGSVQGSKLYVKTPAAEDPRMRKARLVLNMFPGGGQVIFYCEDTKKRLGAQAQLHSSMVKELEELFGKENVVVK